MRHAILGVGGVGGLIAAALAKSGESVTLLLRPEALTTYPAQLSLQSPFGNFSVPVERRTRLEQPADVVWIATKATQLDTALTALPHEIAIGTVVPLLNGVDHLARLRGRFGGDVVVPATIAVESERVRPGEIVQRSPFARLNLASSGQSRLSRAVEKLRSFGFTCQFIDDERTLMWSKLVFLAPLALASTAAASTTDILLSDPALREQLKACLYECCAVAVAEGAKVDPAQVWTVFETLPAGMRSSMQKDVAAGRTPELDAIAGPILRGAERHRLSAPATNTLVNAIRSKLTVHGAR